LTGFNKANHAVFPATEILRCIINAFFHESAAQWANTLLRLRLPHLPDKLALFETGTEIVLGIHAIATPGHTPGMIAVAISAGGAQLLFICGAKNTAGSTSGGHHSRCSARINGGRLPTWRRSSSFWRRRPRPHCALTAMAHRARSVS
jgi:hypothetical protein